MPHGLTPSKYHVCPHADHNMHMDNPLAFANIIINDLIPGAALPVLSPAEYAQLGYSVDEVDYQSEFNKDLSFVEKELKNQDEVV